MARKIPAYKKVVLTSPGAQPEIPAPPTSEELQLSQARHDQEKLDTRRETALQAQKIPHKVLTAMEMRSRAVALMNEKGYDPVRELIKIAANNLTDERTRIDIHKHLAKYVYPEQKAVDLQVSGDLNLTVNVVKFSTGGGQLAPNREAIPVRAVEVAS